MNKIEQLTDIQYEILSRLDFDWCYPFSYFDELKLTRKELSQEFKILREAGLVEFENGLMTEEGEVAGSGYCNNHRAMNKVYELIETYEKLYNLRETI